ncbi:two-component system sensor histidine kinase PhoQ [Halioxenophilus aromaticivorans]|uniref:histidine kinase n=1 Tax=Halioxenophilus aromaticivorans TaxID=1306992 RepID=A0AAV3U106_9ALTE
MLALKKPRRPNWKFVKNFDSLSGRLIIASVLVLPIFVLMSGVALDRSFARSQEVAELERMRVQVYLLLGAAEIFDGQIWLPDQLQEPRFNQPESGLYARVTGNDQVLWQSPSALMTTFPESNASPLFTGQEIYWSTTVGDKAAKALSFDVAWDTEDGLEKNYRFEVYHDQTAVTAERASYQRQLWRWLGSMTILLIVIQWAIQLWGLRPLKGLADDLGKLHSGENLTLSENYPAEIKPVIQNLNEVLVAEREQRDRYRHTLGDLAHSLKTPLAVIRSNLSSGELQRSVVNEQITRMDDIVRHQLQRSVSQSGNSVKRQCDLKPIIERLLTALGKVYRDKNLTITTDLAEPCMMAGDESDFMEMLGNLLDNACKYTHQQVHVAAYEQAEELVINISDDGPGVPEHKRATILQRGARADTAQSGQGIGLAVVVDILSSYGGSLTVDESHFGGAEFTIELPIPSRA